MTSEHRAPEPRGSRWRQRPVLSFLLRATVFLVPIAVAVAIALAISRWLPAPSSVFETMVWWAISLVAVALTWLVMTRALRRLLPLAALLNLSLLFPDAAPSRFRLARRSGDARSLERDMARAREAGTDDDVTHRGEAILSLVAALSVHDRATRGHSERVRVLAAMLGEELKLSRDQLDRLNWAALLHDVGKLAVPQRLLNKEGRPADDEWEVIHQHPHEGERLVAPLAAWLGEWALAVSHHHERFDGSGYPRGLRGQEISLAGRIVAVADSYETMTAARPYKSAMSVRAARQELVRMSGSHFDPAVVRAFLNISVGSLWRTVGFEAVLAELPLLAPVTRRVPYFGGNLSSAAALAVTMGLMVGSGIFGQPGSSAPGGVVGAQARGGNPSSRPAAAAPDPGVPSPRGDSPAEPTRTPTDPAAAVAPVQTAMDTTPPGAATPAAAASAPAAPASVPPPAAGPGLQPYPNGLMGRPLPPGIAQKPGHFDRWAQKH